MSNYLSDQEIETIKNEINKDYNYLRHLEIQVKKISTDIQNKKDFLVKNCRHNKLIDRTNSGEHTEYYCDRCGMDL